MEPGVSSRWKALRVNSWQWWGPSPQACTTHSQQGLLVWTSPFPPVSHSSKAEWGGPGSQPWWISILPQLPSPLVSSSRRQTDVHGQTRSRPQRAQPAEQTLHGAFINHERMGCRAGGGLWAAVTALRVPGQSKSSCSPGLGSFTPASGPPLSPGSTC